MIFRCLLKFHLNCLVVWTNKLAVLKWSWFLLVAFQTISVRILAFGVFGPYSFYVNDGRAVTVTVTNMFMWWINSYSQGYTLDQPCHCLVPTRWSNSTYCSEVDGHSLGQYLHTASFPIVATFLGQPICLICQAVFSFGWDYL